MQASGRVVLGVAVAAFAAAGVAGCGDELPSDAGAAASTPPVTSAAQAPADPRLADYRHALEQAGVGSAPPDGTLTAMAAGICAQLADGADPAAVADALGSWGEWGSDGSALSPAAIRTVYVDAAGDVYC